MSSKTPIHPPQQQQQPVASPPVSLVLTVVLLLVLFVGFFCVLFCRCLVEAIIHGRNPEGNPNTTNLVASNTSDEILGLDPSLIQTFPTFTYSSVKDFRREKYGLECAICLAEFSDDDLLRLLTVCYHVFHQECIDLWLQSHKTCPVCRQDLDLPRETLLEMAPQTNNTPNVHSSNASNDIEHSISIQIRGEKGEGSGGGGNGEGLGDCQQNGKEEKMERFSRSQSTGHSIFARKREGEAEEEDRYTLRLVDNVKMGITTRGHCTAGSCITFGDFSSSSPPANGGFGEVSGCAGTGDINKL